MSFSRVSSLGWILREVKHLGMWGGRYGILQFPIKSDAFCISILSRLYKYHDFRAVSVQVRAYTKLVRVFALCSFLLGVDAWTKDTPSSGMSSSTDVLSKPSFAHHGSSSAAWSLIPALCITSKFNSDNSSFQQTSRLVESAKLSIYFRASCFVRTVNLCPSGYGLTRRYAHTTAKHSR